MANKNLFDLVFAIIAPEIKIALLEIKAIKGIGKTAIRKLTKDITNVQKQLPALKGSKVDVDKAKKLLAKTLGTTESKAFIELLSAPGKFADKLGKLSTQERKELGEAIAEATGGIEESALNSSWLISGIYEETGLGVGSLTLTTVEGKSYDYPNVPTLVWEQMKAAKGSNGSGAGSVFWALYLRKFNKTRARARTAIAFRLAR